VNPCTLPETGAEFLPFVALAVVLLIAGTVALLATRRRGRAWLSGLAVAGLVVAGLTLPAPLTASAADCDPTPAAVNHAPIAVPDSAGVVEDGEGATISGDLLVDDTDEDGDPLTVTTVGTFTLKYGTIVVTADGRYTYTLDNTNPAVDALDEGETLTDVFRYTISDGRGGTASAKLSITIAGTTDNRAPVTNPDAASVKEDTAPNPISGNVLTNDTDTDGDTLAVTNAGTFTLGYGVLVIHADGSYSYTLDNSNPAVNALNNGQHLVDSFAYSISDGHGGTASAGLTVTINGTSDNSPPEVAADTNTLREDAVPNTVSGNVLSNDSDPDGNTMSVANAGTVTLQYGSLEIHADGSYTYTLDNSNPAVDALNNGQHLTDTFTYTASDGHGGTASSTLTIRIDGTTDAPV